MATPASGRSAAFVGLCAALLLVPAMRVSLAQQPSPAAGPWSGQAQCVVVATGAGYQDQQTHTWQLTGAAPTPTPRGSAQVFYTWPATWNVGGGGSKALTPATPGTTARGGQAERWTIASQMNMSLRITELGTGRLRIGAEDQRGAPLGSIRVTEASGRTREASVQPWTFPAIEDSAANTTISGTSTRTYPEGFGVGWGQPSKAVTTATCTWSFTRGVVVQSSANTPAGGRGVPAGSLGGATGGGGPSSPGAPIGASAGTVEFTASGAFTVPAGVTRVIVELWGAGGGGGSGLPGGCTITYSCSGGPGGHGGGSGAYTRVVLTVTPGAALDVSIGSGGAAGADGAPSRLTRGGTVLALADGGKSGSTGGAGGVVSTLPGVVARPGNGGASGGSPPPPSGSLTMHASGLVSYSGAPGGAGGAGVLGTLSPVGSNGGSGGNGGAVVCTYVAASVQFSCANGPGGSGMPGSSGYALLTW